MLTCDILGLVQEMNFEDNVTTTLLALRLPDGRTLRVPIDDEVAATLVDCQVKTHGAPQGVSSQAEVTSAPVELPHSEEPNEWVQLFGEEVPPDPPAAPASAGTIPGIIVPPMPQLKSRIQYIPDGKGGQKPYVPSLTVPRDEYGYPKVPGMRAEAQTDTQDYGGSDDESGIAQV